MSRLRIPTMVVDSDGEEWSIGLPSLLTEGQLLVLKLEDTAVVRGRVKLVRVTYVGRFDNGVDAYCYQKVTLEDDVITLVVECLDCRLVQELPVTCMDEVHDLREGLGPCVACKSRMVQSKVKHASSIRLENSHEASRDRVL